MSRNVYEPSVVSDGDTHIMVFRAESRAEAPGTCLGRLGVAFSKNGRNFRCQTEPLLVRDSPYESWGLTAPRITSAGGVFLMTYSAYDGKKYRLCLATSSDLTHWFRHGPISPELEHDETPITASILPCPADDGKYLMYIGSDDLLLATSDNLIDWELESKPVLTRKKCPDFASRAIEVGPSPFLSQHGIVLILNGIDERNHARVFAALFQLDKPGKCLANLKGPFLEAEQDWERFGYLPNRVRATGLTHVRGKMHLYFSGGDRCVGIASAKVPANYLFEMTAEDSKAKTASKKKKKTVKRKKVCGV